MAQLPEAARHRALLTSNGIDASHLDEGPNRHWQFMYAAWPTAGLQPLLERWASITSALRNSALGRARAAELGQPELHVYYGFPRWLERMHGESPPPYPPPYLPLTPPLTPPLTTPLRPPPTPPLAPPYPPPPF